MLCFPFSSSFFLRLAGADPVSGHLSAYLQMAVLLHFLGGFLFLHVFSANGVSTGSVGVVRHITARSLRPWIGCSAPFSWATPLLGSGVLCSDALFREVLAGRKSVLSAFLGCAVILVLRSFSYISNGRGSGEYECAATATSVCAFVGQIVIVSAVFWFCGIRVRSGMS